MAQPFKKTPTTTRARPSGANQVKAAVAFNPDSELLPTLRSNGIGYAQITPQGEQLAGRSALLKLDGWNLGDMQIQADLLAKFFCVGSHVKVVGGTRYVGETGLVVKVLAGEADEAGAAEDDEGAPSKPKKRGGGQMLEIFSDLTQGQIKVKAEYVQECAEVSAGLERLGQYELYDLQEDPYEWTNLAEDPAHADQLAALLDALQAWQAETGDTMCDDELRTRFLEQEVRGRSGRGNWTYEDFLDPRGE